MKCVNIRNVNNLILISQNHLYSFVHTHTHATASRSPIYVPANISSSDMLAKLCTNNRKYPKSPAPHPDYRDKVETVR